MFDHLQHFEWTSRASICDDLLTVMESIAPGPLLDRVWLVLSHLADGRERAAFEQRLLARAERAEVDDLSLETLVRLGGQLDGDAALRVLHAIRSAPEHDRWWRRIAALAALGTDVGILAEVLDGLPKDRLGALLGEPIVGKAALGRWLPLANLEDPTDLRTLCIALPAPAAARVVLGSRSARWPWMDPRQLEAWPAAVLEALWEHAPSLSPVLREHVELEALATNAFALPAEYLLAETGERELRTIVERAIADVRRDDAHRSRELAVLRDAMQHGDRVVATVRMRIKGGYSAALGSGHQVHRIATSNPLSPGDSVTCVVERIHDRGTALLALAPDGRTPREFPAPPRPPPGVAETRRVLRFAAHWYGSRDLVLAILDDVACGMSLRTTAYHVLQEAHAIDAHAWALRAPWDTLVPSARITRLSSLRFGDLDALGEDDARRALNDPSSSVRHLGQWLIESRADALDRWRVEIEAHADSAWAARALVRGDIADSQRGYAVLERTWEQGGVGDQQRSLSLLIAHDARWRDTCEAHLRTPSTNRALHRRQQAAAGALARIGDTDACTRLLRVSLDPACTCFAEYLAPRWAA